MKTLLLLSLLLAPPALARIGETREQCEARYGKPLKIEEEDQVFRYKKADFSVTCIFRRGVCAHIAISHEVDGEPLYAPMSESEITTLLNANGGGKPWIGDAKASKPEYRVWTCEDLIADYSGDSVNILSISTKAFRDERESEKNGKPKDPLKDF